MAALAGDSVQRPAQGDSDQGELDGHHSLITTSNLLLGSGDDVGGEVDGGEGALKGHICILNCN